MVAAGATFVVVVIVIVVLVLVVLVVLLVLHVLLILLVLLVGPHVLGVLNARCWRQSVRIALYLSVRGVRGKARRRRFFVRPARHQPVMELSVQLFYRFAARASAASERRGRRALARARWGKSFRVGRKILPYGRKNLPCGRKNLPYGSFFLPHVTFRDLAGHFFSHRRIARARASAFAGRYDTSYIATPWRRAGAEWLRTPRRLRRVQAPGAGASSCARRCSAA